MRSLIIIASLAICASPALSGPYDGDFYDRANGPSADYCTPTPEGGTAEIKGDQIFFYETYCDLSNPVAVRGIDATLYDASCSGEGPKSEKRIMIMRPREGDGVFVLTEYFVYDWATCPAG